MRFLCLLVGEPDMEVPAPGSAEFTQMLSDYESATRAVAMAEGPTAGLAILDSLREDDQCRRCHLLHAWRADLLRRLGRSGEACDACRAALDCDPPPAEREFLAGRLAEIDR